MRQGLAVDVFQFTTHGYALCDTRCFHISAGRHFTDVVRGHFAFHSGIGGKYDFPDFAFIEPLLQLVQTQFRRSDTVQRRQPAHQDKKMAAVAGGLFDGQHVCGIFNNTQLRGIACLVCTDVAHLVFGKGSAALATADFFQRGFQRVRQLSGSITFPLKQVKRHALRGFWSDTREATQCIHQLFEQGFFHTIKMAG